METLQGLFMPATERVIRNMRMPLRFKLRTLLICVTLIAIALAAHPRIRLYLKWRHVRENVAAWASKIKREKGHVEQYTEVNLSIDLTSANPQLHSISFTVMTAEAKKAVLPSGEITWTTDGDPDRIPTPPASLSFLLANGLMMSTV